MGCRIPRGDVLAQGLPLCLMASWKGVSYNVFRSTLTGPACPCPGFWGSQWSPGLSITPPREACLSREKSVSSEGRATSSEGGTGEAMSPAGGLRQWRDFWSWLLELAPWGGRGGSLQGPSSPGASGVPWAAVATQCPPWAGPCLPTPWGVGEGQGWATAGP